VIAEIVSLSRYESQVSALMDEEERAAMEFFIACAPLDHPIIPGAGGFRKARWARRGQRKEWWLSGDLLLHRGTRTDLHGVDIR